MTISTIPIVYFNTISYNSNKTLSALWGFTWFHLRSALHRCPQKFFGLPESDPQPPDRI